MKKLLLFVISLCISLPCFPETIKLKSGKTVEAKILEKTDSYIKVDIAGIPITYYLDDIESIDGVTSSKEREKTPSSQTTVVDVSSSGIDTTHIRKLLKDLGYPEHTWPAIEGELTVFFSKIDFPRLKEEAARVKSNPEQLKQFVSQIGGLIEQEGCINYRSPHPLIKLLITSLGTEDIFQVIESSPISQQEKEESRYVLVACSAISQLGFILLESLDMNVKVAFSPEHVFNCIPLDDQRILLIDFLNKIFEIVDISQYYKLEGKYQVLKEEYRLGPKRVCEIKEQGQIGLRPDTPKEVLNLAFFYIYITDDYAATPAIYNNYGDAYNKQGNPAQAISNCTKAIEINPNYADAYHNRGRAYDSQGNFFQAISDYNKAIEIDPNLADAYNNRGVVYGKQGNPAQELSDYNKAIEINPNYADAYYNRGNAYDHQGNPTQAISDYTKAIEINPSYVYAYVNRGITYADQGNSSQAISDYNKAIEINPNYAKAYYNRGNVYSHQSNLSQAISDYTKAIEINPSYVYAYVNRGLAYFAQKDFTKAWEDVHKAESLGVNIDPGFIEDLKKASGREK